MATSGPHGPLVAGAGPQHRVLRGGAFNNNARNVRCSARNRNHPNDRNDNVGFRVAVSTLAKAGTARWNPLAGRGEWRGPLLAGPDDGPGA